MQMGFFVRIAKMLPYAPVVVGFISLARTRTQLVVSVEL
jgi:hypothetical protein